MIHENTPGPWTIHHRFILARGATDTFDGGVWAPIAQALPLIARSEGRVWQAEGNQAANLRLMAAAPDLLVALAGLVAKSTDRDGDWSAEWRAALAAMAKATGAA